MLPAQMPMDKAANDRGTPNNKHGIALPDATGSGRDPLAPAPKSNGDKLLLHNKKFRSIHHRGAQGQPKGNGIKDGLVRRARVYAVVFWLPWLGYCAWGAPVALLVKIFLLPAAKFPDHLQALG